MDLTRKFHGYPSAQDNFVCSIFSRMDRTN